jgi:RNA-directed DNA polymerase
LHHIGNRQWTFSVPIGHKNADGEPLYVKLEYATDTKIIRFKKIVAEANPFDEYWTDYFEEREGEKMLNSTKGREKLLTIWRRQNRHCPVCGDLITSETGFKVHTPAKRYSRKIMVHKECHKQIHSLISILSRIPVKGVFRKA